VKADINGAQIHYRREGAGFPVLMLHAAIADSSESGAFTRMLVQLGKALGLETLAEGIEDQAQYTQLQEDQCDSGQRTCSFVAGALGMTIDLDSLFKRKTPFVLGDRELLALGPEERFIHACMNAALGRDVSRHSLRDIAQMVLNNRLDTDRVVRVAERWRSGAVAARAIELTWSTLDLADAVPLSAWAGRYQSRLHERRVLNSYVSGDGSYTRQAISAIRVIPRRRDKLAYARALLFPQQRHLEARSSGRFRHLWRGAGHLRGGHTS